MRPAKPESPPRRYVVLDSYRFIAALGIVIYHFEPHFGVFRPHQTEVLDRVQSLVDFFFVLSGFVLMHTYGTRVDGLGSYADFLRKRLARIYPLQVATVALCVLIYVVVAIAGLKVRDHTIVDMGQVLPNLLLIQAWGVSDHMGLDTPSWSISAEAFVYLLFPAFAAVVVQLRPMRALALAVLIALAIEVVRSMAGLRSRTLATFDFGMLRAVPMFLAGIAVSVFVAARPPRPMSWLVPHGLFAVIVVLMLARAPFAAIDLLYPPLVALIALAERGGRKTRLASPVFARLGEASFAIYMLHAFVQIACVGLIRRFGWTSPPELIGIAIVATVLIVGLGLASFTLFETPLRRRLGGPPHRPEGSARPLVPAPRLADRSSP